MNKKVSNEKWTKNLKDEHFTNIEFSELIIQNAKLIRVKFTNCKFLNCSLGFGSSYDSCVFEKYSCL